MAEEKKTVKKQSKKSVAPKKDAQKPAAEKPAPKAESKPAKINTSSKDDIVVGSKVLTPFGNITEVHSIENEYCFVRKQENRKKLYKILKQELKLVK